MSSLSKSLPLCGRCVSTHTTDNLDVGIFRMYNANKLKHLQHSRLKLYGEIYLRARVSVRVSVLY